MTNNPPSGTSGCDSRNAAKPFNNLVASSLVFRRHSSCALLVRFECTGCSILHKRRWASARLLQHEEHRTDDRFGTGTVSNAPACHRISLREAIDQDRPFAGVGRNGRW